MISVKSEAGNQARSFPVGIGGSSSGETVTGESAGPGDELAAALRPRFGRGVSISRGTSTSTVGGVVIDIVVSGPRGRFGIVYDAMDAARIRLRPSLMDEASLGCVYCVSAVDSLMDPRGVVDSLARWEPGCIRRSSSAAARNPLVIERVDRDDPGSRLPRTRRFTGGVAVTLGGRAA